MDYDSVISTPSFSKGGATFYHLLMSVFFKLKRYYWKRFFSQIKENVIWKSLLVFNYLNAPVEFKVKKVKR